MATFPSDWTEISFGVLAVAGTVSAISIAISNYFRLRTESRRTLEMLSRQEIGPRYESRETHFMLREILDRVERGRSFQDRAISSLASETNAILEARLKALTDQVITQLGHLSYGAQPQTVGQTTGRSVAREIAHALLTPLSRIDAIASIMNEFRPPDDVKKDADKIKAAIQLCYIYVNAFRATYYAPDSSEKKPPFDEVISRATSVYIDQCGSSRTLSISAPDRVVGADEYYILACALPLIENAVDATKSGDKISILVKEAADEVSIAVTNLLRQPFSENAFENGFSTKKSGDGSESHEGLGLGIARNLAQSVGGHVAYETHGRRITFKVSIPGKKNG